ncbi:MULTISPECIES: aldehyde dehydrogenase family protein [unclassified Micromonospora]|uniref:aldehyde dehydrogenase family protein n=1 Tax=unclassified Micromonospora TaxID=2617518 RepID=UPI003A835A52
MQAEMNYIDGQWVAADDHRPDVNPSNTADFVGLYPQSGRAAVDDAVAAARAAAPGWARSSPQLRADILEAVAAELLGRVDELGRLLAREEGKPVREAVAEATRAGHLFRFFSGEALRMGGERIPSTRPGVTVDIIREPVGVVGIITPWNFPMAIPAWKIAPALAYGNTVVFKPADLVPACAHAIVDCLHRAGLPPGVLNLVMGPGSTVGSAITESSGVDAVTFTGSVGVGRGIAVAAASRLARVQLEMGGKNPLVVMADADLDLAVDCAIQGAYFSTGQRCTASSRLIVEEAIQDRFVAAMVNRMRTLTVGDALSESTDIGPVVDERQLATDLEYIELARADAEVYGGDLVQRATPGYYLAPALITGAANDHRVNREEIFGPVAAVLPVADYDEALAVANDTEFGLTAGICTTSLRHAEHFRNNAAAGMVMVNLPTAGVDVHVPFGGSKGSSYGPREQGQHARHFYTSTRTSYLRA